MCQRTGGGWAPEQGSVWASVLPFVTKLGFFGLVPRGSSEESSRVDGELGETCPHLPG